MVHVTKNNYVINDNKNKMAQGSGQRLKAEAEAEKLHDVIHVVLGVISTLSVLYIVSYAKHVVTDVIYLVADVIDFVSCVN